MEDNDREYVQSLERGLNVLRSFDSQNARMSLSEVAVRTGLSRATARRFLLTLSRLNLVASDGKYFWLLPGVLDLGYRYLSGLPWWNDAQPIIEDISRQIHESCSISVLDDTDIVYVSRAAVNRILSTSISIGSRFPAFCTAMGRAILSGLPDDDLDRVLARVQLTAFTDRTITDPATLRKVLIDGRKKGYAISDGELELNLRGLAVPIFDVGGHAVASVGISVHSGIETQEQLLVRGLDILRQGATRITQSIQAKQFHPVGLVQ